MQDLSCESDFYFTLWAVDSPGRTLRERNLSRSVRPGETTARKVLLFASSSKIIFITIASHLASLRNRGLGNSEIVYFGGFWHPITGRRELNEASKITNWILMRASFIYLFNWRMYLVFYLTHYVSFRLFSYSLALPVTVLTLWVAPPEMFYICYRS